MAIDRPRRSQGGYVPLRDAMERLFEGSFITPQLLAGQGTYPPVDVYVTEENIVIEMAVPGANSDDINVSVTGDTVTLSGQIKHKHEEQRGQAFLDEIWRGQFQRSFTLPIQVDASKAEANFDNGILELVLPKSEATKPRKIQVRGQSSQSESGTTAAAGQQASE